MLMLMQCSWLTCKLTLGVLQMITCCQITYTIPWLSCEQLPYPSKQPRISRIWQRDKSKIPLLISTYKYLLPHHSFSTLPSSIPKFISSAVALTKNKNSSNKSLPQNLLLHREEMAVNFTVPEVNLFPSFFFLYCNPFTFLQVYLLSLFFPFLPILLISKL